MSENFSFDAEVDKIFQLMIHSLYENKEIFLRELISNASDACDKLRYKAITKPELLGDTQLAIHVAYDKEAKTLTITDNGIGMTRDEMIKNLGTIARSGTQRFMQKLSGDSKKDTQLIGQFGVGFYASFMVADKVEVVSIAAGKKQAHRWISEAKNGFTITSEKQPETVLKDGHGTHIILYLKDDAEEFLDYFRLRHIVQSYSNHVAFPIHIEGGEEDEAQANDGKAIWTKQKSDVSEEEYLDFYRSIASMGQEKPWLTLHNHAEGLLNYSSLLFVPSSTPFDLFHPDRETQVKLYVKRVFIAERNVDIIPPYLRFVRGVVDSEDLPLNISRETVQNDVILHKIKRGISKKILAELSKKRKKDIDAYASNFWAHFGAVLKEGLCDGMELRDEILEACLFKSSKHADEWTTLAEYKTRMQEDQDAIYYITADSYQSGLNSPQLEGLKAKNIEVLILSDSVDEFWAGVLHEYQGTPLKSATRLDKSEQSEAAKETQQEDHVSITALIARMQETLGGQVSDVSTTDRLQESPVCLAVADGMMDIRMERFMRENKQLKEASPKWLQINPTHPIITQLAAQLEKDATNAQIDDSIHLLFAQANIAEGEPVQDVTGFTQRLNNLLNAQLAA